MTSSDSHRARILIVDDDTELVDMLAQYLAREGFSISACHEGNQALTLLAAEAFDLLILDVMLPGRNGLELLRQISPLYPALGVVMLTARGDAVDRILGLELGADDYLPKPFDPRELSARIRAVLRRREAIAREPTRHDTATAPRRILLGALQLDLERKQAWAHDQILPLTAAEFRVLQCLLQSLGSAVDRDTLTNVALGRKLTLYDRSIDTHISNLRRKLERSGATNILIQSVRGAGYEILERQP
jgi:two-component system response regulator CpxR